jgi:predicted N-acyltransferase
MPAIDYVTRVVESIQEVNPQAWDALVLALPDPSPFLQYAYLSAMQTSGSACQATGWTPHFLLLENAGELIAACPLYLKDHSYGEYVFDWAWANAYQQHGLAY